MQQENLGNAPAPAMEPASIPVSSVNTGTTTHEHSSSVETPRQSNESAKPVYTNEQQQHLNNLLAAQKKKGYDQALRDLEQKTSQSTFDGQYQQNMALSAPAFDEKKIEEMVEKKSQQVLQKTLQDFQAQAMAQHQQKEDDQLANELVPKIEAAKQKYEDFADKVDLTIFDNNRDWFKALNSVDNAGEVMYEMIVNSPSKFTTFKSLITDPNPAIRKMGLSQIQTFSQSLKNNEASASKRIPASPLTDIRPSNLKGSGVTDVTRWSRDKYKGRI